MKLPFDLGVKLFFRLLLPGFFLTLGALPVLLALLDAVGLEQQHEAAFVLAVIVAGWLVVAADAPVYMMLEGRRYWPGALRTWFVKREQRRLRGLDAIIDRYYAAPDRASDLELKRRYLEASVAKRAFPLGEQDGLRYAELPTRLGNTITAFETYPKSRYGLEAIFYWPRIWVNLNKDLREELDGQQAMADSAVYCTFALGVAGVTWLGFGALELVRPGVLHYLPGATTTFLVAVAAMVLAYVVSRLAVFANEQFGTVFMAVVDANVKKLRSEYVDVAGIVRKVESITKTQASGDDELEVARRYLQYYNVKLPGSERAVPVPQAVAPGRKPD